jgi:hypothetical protein
VAVDLDRPDHKWSILKNPATTQLHLSETLTTAYSIFDVTGHQVQAGNIDGQVIAIDQLPTGTYLLLIGREFARFVKQ